MRHIKGTIQTHEDTGLQGFVPNMFQDWYDSGLYYPSIRLGHDFTSHTSKEDGSLEHEFRALGAELWIAEMGSSYQNYFRSNEDIFANNLESTIDQTFHLDYGLNHNLDIAPKFPKFKELDKITEFFNEAYKILRHNLFVNLDLDYDVDKEALGLWLYRNKQTMLNWILYGYYNACYRRYKGKDPYEVYQTRQAINNLESKLASLEEGDECTISYNLRGEVNLKVHNKYWNE